MGVLRRESRAWRRLTPEYLLSFGSMSTRSWVAMESVLRPTYRLGV
ncbi:hypothetical protein EV652_1223 [Kribbella steppae]|uniref:Uncharacterized protein n=1 Tax=Kribbella steppae TaxID=2512223 RepID=A0A4R2GXV6_9ACTN|nr:hypothetical protein EV652_1223 [Kribbella steppae]